MVCQVSRPNSTRLYAFLLDVRSPIWSPCTVSYKFLIFSHFSNLMRSTSPWRFWLLQLTSEQPLKLAAVMQVLITPFVFFVGLLFNLYTFFFQKSSLKVLLSLNFKVVSVSNSIRGGIHESALLFFETKTEWDWLSSYLITGTCVVNHHAAHSCNWSIICDRHRW